MNEELNVIKIDSIEIPMSFFETNLRIKSKIDELFEIYKKKITEVMFEMQEVSKNTFDEKYGRLDYEYLLARFKFYFCRSCIVKGINAAFSISGSRHSFENNVVKYMTAENFEKAMFGEEMINTFSQIKFKN